MAFTVLATNVNRQVNRSWVCGLVAAVVGGLVGWAVPGLAQQTPAHQRVFASDAGLVLNFVKVDKADQFERVIAQVKEALRKSDKPERKEQATSWKVFRAVEPAAGGNVLYVFTIDPPVKGADYTVSSILAEGFPQDVQTVYKEFAESYASGQNVVNLKLVSAFGQ